MYRTYKFIAGVLVLLMSASFSMAQLIPSQSTTSHYKGRIDDINDIAVALTCEGKNCWGELTYLRSKDQFRLQGTRTDELLELKEFNSNDQCTGYLNGKITGNTIDLKWKNTAETIGHSIHLEASNQKAEFPTFCGDNKWIRSYDGMIQGEAAEMILQRVDNNRILGQIFYKKSKQKLAIKGELTESDNLHLRLISEETQEEIGVLRAIYKGDEELKVSFYNAQNSQSFATFKLQKSLNISCLEYADYYTSYDFLFPKSQSAIFNEIMVLLTKDWVGECRNHTRQMRKKAMSASLRASQRAYSWTDVEMLNKEFISGMLTYHNTWSGTEKTKTFNYNFKTSNRIELADIFKRKFDYNSFIKKYIQEAIKYNPLYKNDPDFRKWILQKDFPFFMLGQEGIYFYTNFHIVYGRQKVLIPYKKLKSNIKKNAPIKSLLMLMKK